MTKHSYYYCYIISYQYTIKAHHCYTLHNQEPYKFIMLYTYLLDDDKSGLCIFINTATCQLLILCKCCLLFLVAGSPEVRDL